MEGFYFAAGSLAVWALLVTAIGVRSEDFPRTPGATRVVATISIVLAATTIGLAIYLSANEEDEKDSGEHAALVNWS